MSSTQDNYSRMFMMNELLQDFNDCQLQEFGVELVREIKRMFLVEKRLTFR